MGSGIFISYRRTGGLETARNLRDRLVSLNYKVFFDLTSMREGKFNQQILEEIRQADDFILILSEGALDRCVEKQDWLRIEIQRALLLHKNIIPVWKPSFQGFPAFLPSDIADLKAYDSVKLSEDYYDAFFQKLIIRLKSQRTRSEENEPTYTFVTGRDSQFVTFDEWVNKKVSFKFLRFICFLLLGNILFFLVGLLGTIFYYNSVNVYHILVALACVAIAAVALYSSSFMSRIRKKLSPVIVEMEKSRKIVKRVRNEAGEIGLVKVGMASVKILLPCKYMRIEKIDSKNYVLVSQEGRSLYNMVRKEIVGRGPYETIKTTRYKIECIGKDGIEMFSLDGYRRYD